MALTKFLATFIGVALAAGTLSGCEGGFNLLGGGEEIPAEEPTPKPRRAKRTNSDAALLGAAPSPKPSAPVTQPRAFLYRNVAFDKVRTRAMQQVYEGQTKKAMTTFQSAQRLRPNDPAVQMWMSAIRESAKNPRTGVPTAVDDFKAATQQLRSPVSPVAPAESATGAQPGVQGAAPTLPVPRAVASPVEVDPRLVF